MAAFVKPETVSVKMTDITFKIGIVKFAMQHFVPWAIIYIYYIYLFIKKNIYVYRCPSIKTRSESTSLMPPRP